MERGGWGMCAEGVDAIRVSTMQAKDGWTDRQTGSFLAPSPGQVLQKPQRLPLTSRRLKARPKACTVRFTVADRGRKEAGEKSRVLSRVAPRLPDAGESGE